MRRGVRFGLAWWISKCVSVEGRVDEISKKEGRVETVGVRACVFSVPVTYFGVAPAHL